MKTIRMKRTVYALYNPVKERWWSEGGTGRVSINDAHLFVTREAAERRRNSTWWADKPFTDLYEVEVKALRKL